MYRSFGHGQISIFDQISGPKTYLTLLLLYKILKILRCFFIQISHFYKM